MFARLCILWMWVATKCFSTNGQFQNCILPFWDASKCDDDDKMEWNCKQAMRHTDTHTHTTTWNRKMYKEREMKNWTKIVCLLNFISFVLLFIEILFHWNEKHANNNDSNSTYVPLFDGKKWNEKKNHVFVWLIRKRKIISTYHLPDLKPFNEYKNGKMEHNIQTSQRTCTFCHFSSMHEIPSIHILIDFWDVKRTLSHIHTHTHTHSVACNEQKERKNEWQKLQNTIFSYLCE